MPGVIGHFRELDSLVEAMQAVKDARLGDITVYTPTPRHEIDHVLKPPPSPVRLFTLIGGLAGATFGFWIAIWVSRYWPLVVGGKPVGSWVPYVVFGFEVMVLIGGLATVAGLFINSRLPKLMHTVGYDPRFSSGDFGLWVECDPVNARKCQELMRENGAVEVRRES
jgi:hypothetical protein